MGVSSLALCDNLQGAMNAALWPSEADFSDGNCFFAGMELPAL